MQKETKKGQQESIPGAFGKKHYLKGNGFVSAFGVNSFSFEVQPFKVPFYRIYQDIYLRKPIECASSFRCNIAYSESAFAIIYSTL